MRARTKKWWMILRAGLARDITIGPGRDRYPMTAFSKGRAGSDVV